jgi:hypothetical protein
MKPMTNKRLKIPTGQSESKKGRQLINGQKKKDKRTNNDLQNERHIYIVTENHSAVWKTIKGFIKGTLKMTL